MRKILLLSTAALLLAVPAFAEDTIELTTSLYPPRKARHR